MKHPRIYPIGIQDFESLRQNGYVYVDKTALIYELVKTGKYYFLSRPRRFGKSLLVSTLEAYFQGKRELFKGLAIETLEEDWTVYPVLHFDLNSKSYEDASSLNEILNQHLEKWEAIYGDEKQERSLEERFSYIIEKISLSTGKGVVVLVDEYDKPLLEAIGNEALLEDYRKTLMAFFSVLKSCDRYIEFALLTGVAKFCLANEFGGLNNLYNISQHYRYATLCGFTQSELLNYFADEIAELARAKSQSVDETLNQLVQWYGGYLFDERKESVYNPFCILQVFKRKEFDSYWFKAENPAPLVELLKKSRCSLHKLSEDEIYYDSISAMGTFEDNPIPLLFQSGYLTIKSYDSRFQFYTLGFPNREVEDGFTRFLLPYYASVSKSESSSEIVNLVEAIEGGRVDDFMQRLQSFFADTPYELVRDLELHYQNVLYIVFKLLGFYTQAEYHTSQGRIDLLVKTDHYIYVMEFKLNGTAEEAMQQIEAKNYALPFATDPRTVYKVGANFSTETRGLERWLVK